MAEPIYRCIFQYDKSLLPNSFLQSLEDGVEEIETAITKTGFTIGYPGWNLLYFNALCSMRHERFNHIIETGTNWGCSTIILAQALKDSQQEGRVYSVEIDKENFIKANNYIENSGLKDYIDLIHADSLDYLSNLSLKNNERLTFTFLDGCHDQDHVVKEFDLIYPKLDDKSIVAFDNTYLLCKNNETNQRVNGALRIIQDKYSGNLINFENVSWYTPGMAFWQK